MANLREPKLVEAAKAPITGLAWHVHHDHLAEWCHDYQERVDYIRKTKPLHEQETRLRLFQMVKDPPARLSKARADLDKARTDLDKAWAASNKA